MQTVRSSTFALAVVLASQLAAPSGAAQLVHSSVPGVRVQPGFNAQVFNAGGLPAEMALEANGNILVASNASSGGIRRLSPAGVLLQTSAAITDPDGVAIDPLGRIFGAGDTRITLLGSLSGGANTVFATGFSNLNWIAAHPDGSLYAVENDGRIWKVSSSGQILGTLATLPAWPAIATGPDGALFASRFPPGRLVRVDTVSGAVQELTSGNTLAGHVAFGSGGAFGTDIYVTNSAPGGVTAFPGNLYRVGASGEVCVFATGLGRPLGLLFDSTGGLLVSDFIATNRIVRIFSTGGSVPPPQSPGCVSEPSGAISWWTGDGTASDFHGVSHGILTNGATFAAGKVGQGFSLDGINDYVRVPNTGGIFDFDATESFSWEGWFKTTASGSLRTMIAKEDGNRPTWNSIMNAAGQVTAGLQPNSPSTGTFGVTSAGSYNDGQFHHIAGIVDRSTNTITLVVDGCLEILSTSIPAGSVFVEATTDVLLGARIPGAPDRFWSGALDEFAVYNRALMLAEVDDIAHAGAAGKCKDTDAPVVTILMPENGQVVGATTVDVTAQVYDASATEVSSAPAGVSASLPAGGGLAMGTVPLDEGSNLIVVSAVDASGNVGGSSVTAIRDTIAPAIAVVSPAEGAVLGATPAAFTIQVSDATATMVTFGWNTVELPAGGGTATGDVALSEGPNSVLVTAVDAAGNQSSVTRSVVLDLTAPFVTIDSPADGACFGPGEAPIAVMATVDDLTATAVDSTPSGVSAPLPAGGGIATGAVALLEGLNPIEVRAADETGRTGSDSITVLLDTTPPEVSIASPSAGAAVRGTIDFHAEANDAAPGSGVSRVELYVDQGLFATILAAPYEVALDTTSLADGSHSLEARAFDGKENQAAHALSVLVDNTPPSVAVLSPAEGAYVAGTQAFDASASDGGSGLVSIVLRSGGLAPTGDASASYDPPVAFDTRFGSEDTTRFLDGPLTLTATARDAAGNESEAAVTVTVDNSAPTKSLISPADGSTVSGTLEILAGAEDANLASLEILVDGASLATSSTSPLSASFDTLSRLDGALRIDVIATDLSGNASTCAASVTVDNVSVRVVPSVLNLKSKGKGSTTVLLEGFGLGQLLPTEANAIELRVPGGSPVPATAGFSGDDALSDPDGDGVPDLLIKFDRQALTASIQAGIAAGLIQPDSEVAVRLFARGTFEIGSEAIRIVN